VKKHYKNIEDRIPLIRVGWVFKPGTLNPELLNIGRNIRHLSPKKFEYRFGEQGNIVKMKGPEY
jgi:hypothetical protein